MGKSKMTPEAASRIQSAVDSGRAKSSDAGFKARAARAAARNFGKSGSKGRRKRKPSLAADKESEENRG